MDKKENKRIIEGIKKFKKKSGVEKIIIFGSFSRGNFTEDSDIDLLLISEKFKGKNTLERYKGLWLKWDLNVPVDFICYTQKEFDKLKNQVSIAREAMLEGKEV